MTDSIGKKAAEACYRSKNVYVCASALILGGMIYMTKESKKAGETTADQTSTQLRMPAINRPENPGGGNCRCNCRAGNAADLSSFRFALWTAKSCYEAARDVK